MPNIITELIVERVDLVEEGANSAAFIELYKRREKQKVMEFTDVLAILTSEQSEVVKSKVTDLEGKLAVATDDLTKNNEKIIELTSTLDAVTKAKEEAEEALKAAKEAEMEAEAKKASGNTIDETEVLKSMPKELQDMFKTLKTQKDVAEDALKKSNEAKAEAEAVSKALSLKNLPIEQSVLVSVLKTASKEVVDLLDVVNAAIDVTVLSEVGKSTNGKEAKDSNASWTKIEAAADVIVKSKGITQAKAIAEVIKTQPELYKQYLNGGAN